jgi:Fur family transcriptional regulator, stress-responsive regulator
MRTTEQLAEAFRSHGRKVTAQRLCIFDLLQGDVTHPSVESVYESARQAVPTISRKTVYQVLYELEDFGEIAVLDLGTGAVRIDPNVETAHHHLVCLTCGSVRDVQTLIPGLHVPTGAEQGYEIQRAEVVFRGLCPTCQHAKPAEATVRQSNEAGSMKNAETAHNRGGK